MSMRRHRLLTSLVCLAAFVCLSGAALPRDETVEWQAGTVVAEGETPDAFTCGPITPELLERMRRGGSRPAAGSPQERQAVDTALLRHVKVLHVDTLGRTVRGELVVAADLADETAAIFRELYRVRYPITSIRLIDDFGANDTLSMAADNTSAYCHRTVAGTDRLSLHAQGRAIDLNPLRNPWVKRRSDGSVAVSPEEGRRWANRRLADSRMIKPGDAALKAFTARGWTWGGAWKSIKDYQHFEKKQPKK